MTQRAPGTEQKAVEALYRPLRVGLRCSTRGATVPFRILRAI